MANQLLNIVPLATPELVTEAPAVAPQLSYRGGPLLAHVQVSAIFWGSFWQQPAPLLLIHQLNQFFDFILTSSLIDQLAEYSVSGYQIGQGQRLGTLTLSSPDVATTFDDSDVRQMLQNQISAGALPPPNANALYFVFLPSGVTVTLGGSASCQMFCGYHDTVSSNIFYAVMPYPDCSGCSSNFPDFDALTVTASHELSEAITDPVPGQGWYDDNNGEIGDICAWQTKIVAQYTIQTEWSNDAQACV